MQGEKRTEIQRHVGGDEEAGKEVLPRVEVGEELWPEGKRWPQALNGNGQPTQTRRCVFLSN